MFGGDLFLNFIEMPNNENRILQLEPLVFTDKRAANEICELMKKVILEDNHHLTKFKIRIHSNMRVVSIRANWEHRRLYCRAHKCSVAIQKFLEEIKTKIFQELQTKDF